MNRAVLLLGILCSIGVTTAAASGTGPLSMTPDSFTVNLTAGETAEQPLHLTFHGNTTETVYLSARINAHETTTNGINVSYAPNPVMMQPGITETVTLSVNAHPALAPDRFTIITHAYTFEENRTEQPPENGTDPGDNNPGSGGDSDDDGRSSSDGEFSYTPVCTAEDWSCTDWTACENGTQTRTCERTTTCRPTDSPMQQRQCNMTTPPANDTGTTGPDQNQSIGNQSNTSNQRQTGQTPTGLLVENTAGVAAVSILLLIAGVYTVRRRLLSQWR